MGREGEMVQRLLPGFARRHPGIRVRVQQIPWSAAHEKLLTAFVGGAMPDVFQAGNTWLPELVALGALEPLDARIAGSAAVARDDYFPGILDTNVIDGVTWGVPWYVDTRLLFYRSDLLAAAGHPEPPRTWAAWTEAMGRLAAPGAAEPRYAILLPVREWEPLVILALQLGADLLRDGGRYGNFRSAPFRAAVAFYLDLFARGLAPRAGAAAAASVYQDFARGLFALYITGPWNLGEFARRLPPDLAGRWATAALPAPPGGAWPGVSLAGGASLAIFRGSARKDAAWALVEYLSEPARQVEFHDLTGDLPARRAAWEAGGLRRDPRTAAFWLQLQSVRATPKIPEWERIASKIAQWAEAAIRGERTVEEALAALDRDVDAILEKRRWLLRRSRHEARPDPPPADAGSG
jgi:multiple sugar transport system substrate-binding protein